MSEAHTPGPWHFRTFHEDGIGGTNGLYNLTRVYVGSKEAQSSIWIADCGDDTDAERIANARLIAAAPDLLAEINRVLVEMHEISAEYTDDSSAFGNGVRYVLGQLNATKLRAAIAKAGGATNV